MIDLTRFQWFLKYLDMLRLKECNIFHNRTQLRFTMLARKVNRFVSGSDEAAKKIILLNSGLKGAAKKNQLARFRLGVLQGRRSPEQQTQQLWR